MYKISVTFSLIIFYFNFIYCGIFKVQFADQCLTRSSQKVLLHQLWNFELRQNVWLRIPRTFIINKIAARQVLAACTVTHGKKNIPQSFNSYTLGFLPVLFKYKIYTLCGSVL